MRVPDIALKLDSSATWHLGHAQIPEATLPRDKQGATWPHRWIIITGAFQKISETNKALSILTNCRRRLSECSWNWCSPRGKPIAVYPESKRHQ